MFHERKRLLIESGKYILNPHCDIHAKCALVLTLPWGELISTHNSHIPLRQSLGRLISHP